MNLQTLIKTIEDEICSVLNNNININDFNINGIMLDGELKHGNQKIPYIHVISEDSNIDNDTFGGFESWILSFSIVAITNPYNASSSHISKSLALKASDILVKYRDNENFSNAFYDLYRSGYNGNYTKNLSEENQINGSSVTMEILTQTGG